MLCKILNKWRTVNLQNVRRRSVLNEKLSLIHRIFHAQIWKKDTLPGLENEHCIKMISVDATINGSVSDVTVGLI